MTFVGPVDTRGRLDVDTRGQIADYIRTFPGKRIAVEVYAADNKKGRRQRTLQQNKYWHAEPFLKLAKAWGCSIQAAKLDVMGEFWGWERSPRGRFYPVKAHTSDMTVEEGTLFLDWLIPWALEQGIEIDLPEQWEQRAA